MKLSWKKIYFTGIGGVGMAGLAQIALDCGVQVCGSDAVDSDYLRCLASRGAVVRIGHDGAIPADTELLVYSSAVSPDNPERQMADRLGIPSMRRGAFLAELSHSFGQVIAVAGSHGKTTTTAMLAAIFRASNRRPGYMIGGMVEGWNGNGAAGDGNLLVTEVDESDGTQSLMTPSLAVILNIEDDHSWSLGGQAALESCFRQLAEQSGDVLAWRDTNAVRVLSGMSNVSWLTDAEIPESMQLRVPGLHNRRNAAIALAVASCHGVDFQTALAALREFPGVSRRLSLRWRNGDGSKLVYEDYAHHPTELEACLQALRERHPDHRMVVFFQPHRQERVRRYGGRFAELLAGWADHAYVMPTFAAWLADGDDDSGPEAIVKAMERLRPGSGEMRELDVTALSGLLRQELMGDGAVMAVIVGAGDIGKLAQEVGGWNENAQRRI